jgi:hypothetical protein
MDKIFPMSKDKTSAIGKKGKKKCERNVQTKLVKRQTNKTG